MVSRKQNNGESLSVVLALPAPGPNAKSPKRRSHVVPRKKKNSPTKQKEKASSSDAKENGASTTTGSSGSKQQNADSADTKEAAEILMDLKLQAKEKNQPKRSAEGITKLQKLTTSAHDGAQIMEETTSFVQQVNNVQQNQEEPIGFNQQQTDLAHAGPQIPNEAAGFNQQQPDLAHGGPQIPEEAGPNENVNDVFEFALNSSILDLD